MQVSGPWIIGTAALTKTQVLAITMFITCSTPPPIRNDTPETHKAMKVVWEPASFNTIISKELGKRSSNKGRIIVTGM